MGYLYLSIAILSEVVATTALKASKGFSVLTPSIITITGYGVAFYCLALVLKYMPVGITYAIWSGMGIVLITLVAAIVFKQIPDTPAIIGILFILTGVVIINVFSKTTGH